jgi:hypothetical protein
LDESFWRTRESARESADLQAAVFEPRMREALQNPEIRSRMEAFIAPGSLFSEQVPDPTLDHKAATPEPQSVMSSEIVNWEIHLPPYDVGITNRNEVDGHPDQHTEGANKQTGLLSIFHRVNTDRGFPWSWAAVGIFVPSPPGLFGRLRFSPRIEFRGHFGLSSAIGDCHAFGKAGLAIWSDAASGGDHREEIPEMDQTLWDHRLSGISKDERDFTGVTNPFMQPVIQTTPGRFYLCLAVQYAECDADEANFFPPCSIAEQFLSSRVTAMVTQTTGISAASQTISSPQPVHWTLAPH